MTQPTPIAAGNWKMNKGPAATRAFFDAFIAAHPARPERSVWFFPPAISLTAAREAVRQRPDLRLGIQNIHWEPAGAYTGEISAPIAAEAGASLALIGHSERRQLFGEMDEAVGRKAVAAFEAGLLPVVCVGETLEERRSGQLETVLFRQLDGALDALNDDQAARLVVAYEPVWAIGTGVTATPADAAAAHALLRNRLRHRIGERAVHVPILYGGSVKPDNAAELLNASNVNGLLVGGASLDPDAFARIAVA